MKKGHVSGMNAENARVLALLVATFLEQDHIPSYQVVADHFGWHMSNAQWHFKRLCDLGYIERAGVRRWRFCRDWDARPVSMMGAVA